MARPLRIEFLGAVYHVISRGNEGKAIFSSPQDRKKLLEYFLIAHQRYKILIHAYCHMDNHYHILIETPLANLSQAMQFINSSYTTYYNRAHKRVGHFFQGRYKSILVDKEAYLLELSRYIHLNPVRAKLVDLPQEYKWSSYQYYCLSKRAPIFLTTDFTLNAFASSPANASVLYKDYIYEGLGRDLPNPLEKVRAGIILGSDDFICHIKETYLKKRKKGRDMPSLRELQVERISPEFIKHCIRQSDEMNEKTRRKVFIYLLRKYTGEKLDEIVKRSSFRISASAVSKIVTRLEMKRKQDEKLDKWIKGIEKELSNVKV